MLRALICTWIVSSLILGFRVDPLLTGTVPSQSPPTLTIHVNNQVPAASDTNPGTRALPLKTVNRAAQIALDYNGKGHPAAVLIHPGVYREAISLPAGGTDAPLIFQATGAGDVVVSGSDVWSGWTRQPGNPVFTHPWSYTWGSAPIPPAWPRVPDIVRRRELVFVHDQPLRQVLAPEEIREGTFFVNESRRLLYIWPNSGLDPNTEKTEVAVRPILFASSGRANLTINGLIFQHAATALDGDAVLLHNVANPVVEHTVFRWNNWGGLGVYAATNVLLRRNVANNNGGRGIAAWKVLGFLYADNETSNNNWRGAWGRFFGWAMGGMKILRNHNGAIRNHKALGNRAFGVWLDFDNQNVMVAGGLWCGNLLAGGFIEASQGPITLVDVTACMNGEDGLFTTESQHVTLKNSILYGNGLAQFHVGGTASRAVDNWETGRPMILQTTNWTLCGNAISGTSSTQYVFSTPEWDFFFRTLTSSRNIWWNPLKRDAFRINGAIDLDLAGWRRVSKQDADSVFADPLFRAPGESNFSPLAGSPWQRC